MTTRTCSTPSPLLALSALFIPLLNGGCDVNVAVLPGGPDPLQVLDSSSTTIRFADLTGNTFFVLLDGDGRQLYTQRGEMQINENQRIITPGGYFVRGYGVDGNFNLRTFEIQNLSIPIGNLTIKQATTLVVVDGVLSTGDTAIGSTVGFSFTAYTLDGTGVSLDVTFTLTASSESKRIWTFSVARADGGEGIFSELLTFDASGNQTSEGTFDVAVDLGSGEQTIRFDLRPINGDPTRITTVEIAKQDGFGLGTLAGFYVRANGEIVGTFDNGLERTIGKFLLALITNPETLVPMDNSVSAAGSDTVAPVIVTAPLE